MSLSERAQRAIERIQEDERLRGDLEDTAATDLVAWASDQAAAADDASLSDEEFAAAVMAIRTAARKAARSGEREAGQIRKLAEEALSSSPPAASGALRKVGQEASPAASAASEQDKPQTSPIDPQQLGALVKEALGSAAPDTSTPMPGQAEKRSTRVKEALSTAEPVESTPTEQPTRPQGEQTQPGPAENPASPEEQTPSSPIELAKQLFERIRKVREEHE
jgi:hypothetical protein